MISVTISDNRTPSTSDMRRVTVVSVDTNGDRTPETMLAAGADYTTNVNTDGYLELKEITVDENGNPVDPSPKG